MARRLETLEAGTPVYCGDQLVGRVDGVYTEGDSRMPEYLAVHWETRGAVILIRTNDIEALEERGVLLQSVDPVVYETTAIFDQQHMPMIKRLA